MCGIVGEIGNDNAVSLLINGLKKLEYRGYDSAGIYVREKNGNNYLVKVQGKIDELSQKVNFSLHGCLGIAHTRWATHGKPSINNAHPFISESGRYVLVHNGVITNYQKLKDKYLKNYKFQSNTDSEVIVQLIDFFSKENMTTMESLKKTLHLLGKGSSYAILLVDTKNPNILYAAKYKSPLLIGVGDSFNVACSDVVAMSNVTNQFIELSDGDIAQLTKNKIIIEDKFGKNVKRNFFEIDKNLYNSNKGNYEYFMLKEIEEQPIVIKRLINKYINDDNTININNSILHDIRNSDRIYIIGAGTSYHAGLVGRKLIEHYTKIPTEVCLSSEFAYNMSLLSKKPFFIFLSQSGETADSYLVLSKLNKLKYHSLTITNTPKSTLARNATYNLLLYAGPEISVASTKAYTAQIVLLTLLAKAIGDLLDNNDSISFDIKKELLLVSSAIDKVINKKLYIKRLAKEYLLGQNRAFYIGRGLDYYTAVEAALKLKEVSYIHTEGFAAGELKHGTIALISSGTPVIAIITEKKLAEHTRNNAEEVLSRGAHLMTIVSSDLSNDKDQIVLPEVYPLLTPLVSILPAQLLAYYASIQQGFDVDHPRNLAKSVTVE